VVTVSYGMRDEFGAASSSTVTITVSGTNHAPVAVADTGAGTEGSSVVLDVLANDTDEDAGHVFTLVSASAPTGKGAARVIGNKLVFSTGTDFDKLAHGANEVVTLNYTMRDEHGAQSSSTVAITINGINDAALIGGQLVGTVEEAGGVNNANGGIKSITRTANITDVDSQALFQQVSTPTATAHGTYVLAANGEWTYTLNDNDSTVQALKSGESALDRFNVVAQDGTIGVVSITIFGANDAAAITGTATGTVIEAGATGTPGTPTASGDLNSTDVDNAADSFQITSHGIATYGNYTVAQNGQWTYTLDNINPSVQILNTGNNLQDSFLVATADGTTETVAITIQGTSDPVNRAPTDIVLTPIVPGDDLPTSGVIAALSTADSDPGDNHTYSIVSQSNSLLYISGDSLAFDVNVVSKSTILQIQTRDTAGGTFTETFNFSFGSNSGDVLGLSGSNVIYAGGGADKVQIPISGTDSWLFGQGGNDTLIGGTGNDWLSGGSGTDQLTGGDGNDMFVFDSAPDGYEDAIVDFTPGDKIVLENTGAGLFNALSTGALAAEEIADPSRATSSTRILYDGLNGELSYDSDGSGANAAVLIAVLQRGTNLDASDFLVI